MPSRRSFLALTGAAAAAGSLRGHASAAETGPIAADRLQGDLDFFRETLLDVSAKPFITSRQGDVERIALRIRESLTGPLSAKAFYLRAAPMFAALNDACASLTLPEFEAAVASRSPIFPLRAVFDGNALTVVRDFSGAVPSGGVINAIDGVGAADLRVQLANLAGGQRPELRARRAADALPALLYARYGEQASFNVDVTLPSEAKVTEGVNAAPPALSAEPYAYRPLNARVGLIDYRRAEDPVRFAAFMREALAGMRRDGIAGLIIDVRATSGDAYEVTNMLLSAVSEKPFKQTGTATIRASATLKRALGREHFSQLYGEDAWSAPDGSLVVAPGSDVAPIIPLSNPLRFAGKLAVLIGPGTWGAGKRCALAAKDFGLAVLVGAETGEPANANGAPFHVAAPASGLVGSFATAYYEAPKPHPDGQGVLPDIAVTPSAADRRMNRDPVLDRGVAAVS